MGKEIQINQTTVTQIKNRIMQLVAVEIGEHGQEISEMTINQIQDSESELLLKLKNHMEVEQRLANQIGASLLHIVEHLNQASNAFQEKDQQYAKETKLL